MSAVSAVLRGRRMAEKMMVDTCTITRPGATVTDPETGAVTRSKTSVYTGKCRVQSKAAAIQSAEAGGAQFTVVSREVHIPANAAKILDGDEVEITASRLNSFTVGKVYRVSGFTPDTFDTAFRLPVKENL